MEYPFSGVLLCNKKKNNLLVHAATWLTLKRVMLSVQGQMQKAAYCMIPHIQNSRVEMLNCQSKGMRLAAKEQEGAFQGMEMLYVITAVIVILLYTLVKAH